MEEAKKLKIIDALKVKGVNLPCPRCGSKSFQVIGATLLQLNDNPNSVVLGGPSVPAAVVACSNCGYLTNHALGALGLMPQVEEEK